MLALNPYDASLWVAGEKVLLHFNAQGKLLQAWEASDEIQAMGLDADESLWLLTHQQLLRFSPQEIVLQSLDLKSLIKISPSTASADCCGWPVKKNLFSLN